MRRSMSVLCSSPRRTFHWMMVVSSGLQRDVMFSILRVRKQATVILQIIRTHAPIHAEEFYNHCRPALLGSRSENSAACSQKGNQKIGSAPKKYSEHPNPVDRGETSPTATNHSSQHHKYTLTTHAPPSHFPPRTIVHRPIQAPHTPRMTASAHHSPNTASAHLQRGQKLAPRLRRA